MGAVAAAYAAAVASANTATAPSTSQISPRPGLASRGAQTGGSLFGGGNGQGNGGRLDASDSPQKGGQPMSESEAMAALEVSG